MPRVPQQLVARARTADPVRWIGIFAVAGLLAYTLLAFVSAPSPVRPELALAGGLAMTALTGLAFWSWGRSRQALVASTRSAAEIHDLYNAAPCGYHSLDEHGTFVAINDTELAWLGYSREEVLGRMSFAELLAEDGRRTFSETFARLTELGHVENLEFELVRRDGSLLPVLLSATVVRDAAGRFVQSRSTVFDITTQKRAADRFQRVVEGAPEAIVAVDRTGIITLVNAQTERLFGYAREELVGQPVELLLPTRFRGSHPTLRHGFFADPGPRAMGAGRDLYGLHKDGQEIPIEIGLSPIEAEEGTLVLASIIDITERKRATDAVLAARAEADRANLAKSEFLSRMSHELRTPLNAVIGFAQLLELDDLSDLQQDNVRYIGRAGRHLLELINEVLDISRIEAGQMTLSIEPVAVAELLAEIAGLVAPLARERSVTIEAGPAECGAHVFADRQRLRQVLVNLLANAVKYNRAGGSVSVTCAELGAGRLRISVADTGYGIPADQLDRLFQPFERLGAEQSGVEGTGMGLALSSGLVEAMGGAIGVDSEVDRGTTVWVELAIAESPLATYENRGPMDTASVAPGHGPARKILCIEDNVSNLKLVERILAHRPKIELVSALRGDLGLGLARTERPDLVLLDLHLPDMSGSEVLRRLKSYPETRDIPVIVLSADATSFQAERLGDEGAAGYLTKPFSIAAFLEVVDRLLGEL